MIKLLDCTLRDGGYVNNWNFGSDNIKKIYNSLKESNVDVIEVGFFKNEIYNKDKTIFNKYSQLKDMFSGQEKKSEIAVMIEVQNPIDLQLIPEKKESIIDILRVVIWRSKLNEENQEESVLDDGYRYCESLIKKGYKVTAQLARINQYSYKDFKSIVKKFAKLKLYAFYIVDSWGTLDHTDLLEYSKITDKYMPKSITIGLHIHDNKMNAVTNSIFFINYFRNRNIIIDSSLSGLGRGAGNLRTEVISQTLNKKEKNKYNFNNLLNTSKKYIEPLKQEYKWGFSDYYLIVATFNANPDYASELEKHNLDYDFSMSFLSQLSLSDRVIYNKNRLIEYNKRGNIK